MAFHIGNHVQHPEQPPLAALAPRGSAVRFTVQSVAQVTDAKLRATSADSVRGGGVVANARLVELRFEGPCVGLTDADDGEPLGDDECDGKTRPLVAVPIIWTGTPDSAFPQTFLMSTQRKADGHYGWLGAAEPPDRGQLLETPASNRKAPSGWEAFDMIDFRAADAAAGGAVAGTPAKAEEARPASPDSGWEAIDMIDFRAAAAAARRHARQGRGGAPCVAGQQAPPRRRVKGRKWDGARIAFSRSQSLALRRLPPGKQPGTVCVPGAAHAG